ncbi:MAG: DUF1743 domain-containing protein [Halobacteriales archaeon]
MTIIGIDDTDSRERGMCTTYLAARIADRIESMPAATVDRCLLVRCTPGVEHKTRGNAALAVHADLDAATAFELAAEELTDIAEVADPRTNPGLVVAPHSPADIPDSVASFAREAMRDIHDLAAARDLIAAHDYRSNGWGNGRGRIGALAAVGAWAAREEWTYELIAYRESDRWGTERTVDRDSVFAAAEAFYPDAWDTVDRIEGEAVCVPHTPGPLLYGIRGDDPDAVRALADRIDTEPIERTRLFVTNQGTDAHLQSGTIGDIQDRRAYRLSGTVVTTPETRRGGHVFFEFRADDRDASLQCAAFEPTKRFRDRVRKLRVGDRLTVCGGVRDGTLKLEKFALRDRRMTERVTPTCSECGNRMESAGAEQGYRCRSCGTTTPGKTEQPIDRELEVGWYEVPPCARRHIAKPLIRGGFDAPTHPER